MPSIIEVDTIKNKTGTQNTVLSTDGSGNNTLNANTIKDGSATKTLAEYSSSAWSWGTPPTGTILQIKDSYLKDVFDYTNGTSSWFAGTASTRADQSHGGVVDDLSLTLTTKGANSTFYIYLHLCECSNNDMDGGYNFGGFIYNSIDSYADPIDKGNARGSRTRVTFGNWLNYRDAPYVTFDMGCQISHTSSLAKGSSLSYRTVISTHYTSGGNTIRIHRDNADADGAHNFMPVSTFRVIEVAT